MIIDKRIIDRQLRARTDANLGENKRSIEGALGLLEDYS